MLNLKEIKRNGGATLNNSGAPVEFKSGYQVSICDVHKVKLENLRPSLLERLLTRVERNTYAGVWIDNGYAYVDISKRYATKAAAMQAGRERKQLTIWNWRKQTAEAVV